MSSELTFRDRFKAVAGDQPHSWGARKGLSKAFIANCLRGTSKPQQRNLDKLVAASGIQEEWWLHGDLPPPAPHRTDKAPASEHRVEQTVADYVAIPLYNGVRASAGNGELVDSEVPDDVMRFSEIWLRFELGAKPRDLYAIRAHGDSMEPTLRSGDILLVDRRATTPDREGVYVMRMSGLLVVKRLRALPGLRLRISGDNPAWGADDVDLADLERDGTTIIGRVVWSGRRL